MNYISIGAISTQALLCPLSLPFPRQGQALRLHDGIFAIGEGEMDWCKDQPLRPSASSATSVRSKSRLKLSCGPTMGRANTFL